MKVRMKSLISYESVLEEPTSVFAEADRLGEVIIIKDNKLAYKIMKIKLEDFNESVHTNAANKDKKSPNKAKKNIHHVRASNGKRKRLTLRDAAIEVLNRYNGEALHVSEISDILYDEKLYLKKDGGKAHYTQVRAMCGHYFDDFQTMPGNRVKLR